MDFVDLVIFLLVSAGATSGVVGSSLLEPVRFFIFSRSDFLKELLSCPMCTGLWVGVFFSAFFGMNPVYAGLSSSLVSWLAYSFADALNTVTFYFETLIEKEESDSDD